MHHLDPDRSILVDASGQAEIAPSPGPISDETQIAGEESHPIQFRLTGSGPVSVHSVPTPHPGHSETGVLGWVAIVKPGGGAPAARTVAHMTDSFMGAE